MQHNTDDLLKPFEDTSNERARLVSWIGCKDKDIEKFADTEGSDPLVEAKRLVEIFKNNASAQIKDQNNFDVTIYAGLYLPFRLNKNVPFTDNMELRGIVKMHFRRDKKGDSFEIDTFIQDEGFKAELKEILGDEMLANCSKRYAKQVLGLE